MKKRFFLFTLLLTIVMQGAWATNHYGATLLPSSRYGVEGPWYFDAVTTEFSRNGERTSYSFYQLDNSAWDARSEFLPEYNPLYDVVYQFSDKNGLGFATKSKTKTESKHAVFSTYFHHENVPAYTRKKLTWNYSLLDFTEEFSQCVVLYAHTNLDELKNAQVDWSAYYNGKTDCPYHLAHLVTPNGNNEDKKDSTQVLTREFQFDNRNGSKAQIKSWYLMLTFMIENWTTREHNIYQWGSFRDEGYTWTSYYYKYVSFHANGGTGAMALQEIENNGNLTANAFTRTGYTFEGWATAPNDTVVYEDGVAINANDSDKGPLDLYAVWTPVNYTISYNLDGGIVETPNPAQYTAADAFTLNNPTKENYTFLGWSGANGIVPQTETTLVMGSTGNRTYTANWISNAVEETIHLIAQIGPVTYDETCKSKIDTARQAYDNLNEPDKIRVSNYNLLLAAEQAYRKAKEKAEGNTTICFVGENDAPVSSQKIALDYPEAPEIEGFTFQYWRPIAEDITAGTIHIQAVYTETPTDLDETIVNGKSSNRKLIKDGNVYILTDEFIYTINGQKVK